MRLPMHTVLFPLRRPGKAIMFQWGLVITATGTLSSARKAHILRELVQSSLHKFLNELVQLFFFPYVAISYLFFLLLLP